MATPALSTLRHVTKRKLNKLADHRGKFETDKKAILERVVAAPDRQSKVKALLEGFNLYDITVGQPDLSISNLEKFIHQAKHDPSVSAALLRDWQVKLEHELDVTSLKFEYAALFGNLVIEWIQHPNPAASTSNASLDSSSDSDLKINDSFDTLGRKEMHEQRKEWESHAFVEKKVDQNKIEAYLNDIFSTTLQAKKLKKTPLQNLRDAMKVVMDFKSDLQTPKQEENPIATTFRTSIKYRLTVDKLISCIHGVLQSDLLVGQKREALADLVNQPAVLKELVDVLNMDLEGLDEWEWDPTPVPLNMRRQLNGKYRVYMDEETHQALLLHFIGKTWAVAMKQAFTAFYRSDEWLQTAHRSINKKARQRREYFIPDSTTHSCTIPKYRQEKYQNEYFMTQLPDDTSDDCRDYDADDKEVSQSGLPQSPLATKQSMLRLVTTELLLNTKLYGEFLVWQSDFKWFGPSLPHDTIFTVLKFFGVPEKWLRFFKKFLEAPVVFAQDGPGAQEHVRKCGIPIGHIISDALGEAVLFCLDFAVNKRTHGANIYRFHDDLWFWGQESTCMQAWEALKEFTTVMGLELNKDKTGSALIVADKPESRALPKALPQGKIKWGFLHLDASAGRWVIDREEVNKHIEELRRQLGACRSVMAWVQAWNSYVSRFFSNNLGKPANCFGRQHNDMIIETFEHIQKSLFADEGTRSVTDHLRGMLKERFGTDDSVPDGFFYFPVEFGGLGLRNPFINAFITYKNCYRDPNERIERSFEEEQEHFERCKEKWDSGESRSKQMDYAPVVREDIETDAEADEPFMKFEEYTKYREELSAHVRSAYVDLLRCPEEESVVSSDELLNALRSCSADETPYWLWIYNLYAGDMKQRFGGQGLQLGERDLLPVGLVDVLKSEKVRWEG